MEQKCAKNEKKRGKILYSRISILTLPRHLNSFSLIEYNSSTI